MFHAESAYQPRASRSPVCIRRRQLVDEQVGGSRPLKARGQPLVGQTPGPLAGRRLYYQSADIQA
jgi:hypothetical protein